LNKILEFAFFGAIYLIIAAVFYKYLPLCNPTNFCAGGQIRDPNIVMLFAILWPVTAGVFVVGGALGVAFHLLSGSISYLAGLL